MNEATARGRAVDAFRWLAVLQVALW